MIVYFLRHAEAEPQQSDDFSRDLTEKGEAQAEKIARFIEREELAPELILTSPVVRAKHTARAVAQRLRETEKTEAPWLACGMTPETCRDQLKAYANLASLLLVGHEPDFSEAIAAFLGLANPEALRVRKGALIAVELDEVEFGAGHLHFSITPRLM